MDLQRQALLSPFFGPECAVDGHSSLTLGSMKAQVTFESTFFKPVAGEEERTNPGRLGQTLAEWLQGRLLDRGVMAEAPLPEDFGWVVMVSRNPYRLWLGCGNSNGSTNEWSIFPEAELSPMQRLGRGRSAEASVKELWRHVQDIVPTIPSVKGIKWE